MPTGPDSKEQSTVDLCEDLYSSTCLDSKGRNKYENRIEELRKSGVGVIEKLQDEVARQAGSSSIDHLLIRRLAESGLELKPNLESSVWNEFKLNAVSPYSHSSEYAREVFKETSLCQKDYNDAKNFSSIEKSDKRKFIDLNKALIKEYQSELIDFYAEDLDFFYVYHVRSLCYQYSSVPEGMNVKSMESVQSKCSNLGKIRREAVELYRKKDQDNYKDLAKSFVNKNMIPYISYARRPSSNKSVTKEFPEIYEASEMLNIFNHTCDAMAEVYGYFSRKIIQETTQEINSSQAMINGLVQEYFSTDKNQKVDRLFEGVKSQLHELVAKFVKDRNTQIKISEKIDSIEIKRLQSPPSRYFTLKTLNSPTLNPDTIPASLSEANNLKIFLDPTLSYFYIYNAGYKTNYSLGSWQEGPNITLDPLLIKEFEKNPMIILTVLAHEISHEIGLQQSAVNGYDLSAEYEELMRCYRSEDSISMIPSQSDEVIADYLASEILASFLQSIEANKRKSAIKSAMQFYCIADINILSLEDVHPNEILRVNGIFGASPNLRGVLGCEKGSGNYKECGLQVDLIKDLTKGSNTSSESKREGTSR